MTPRARMKAVVYLRVSTKRQGHSGLGLEAQQASIDAFVKQRDAVVLKTFTEIESGKNNNRPELQQALHLTKVTGGTLVIAKLDRLSRNAAFLLTLRDSGVRFVAADLPDVDRTTVGILAIVAEAERDMISKRTTEALAAAKRRGIRLGCPLGAEPFRKAGKGNVDAIKAVRENADKKAEDLRPIIESLRADGVKSLGRIAQALEERGILTARGGKWHRCTVRDLLMRLDRRATA